MKIESSLASGRELASERGRPSTKKSRKRRRRPGSMPGLVQRLFETCKEVFADGRAGFLPSPEDVVRLRSILDNMNASDVGLSQNMPYFWNVEPQGTPPITYLHLYECDKFSIGIFCLPPSGVIPLHNHPGMTVFSKLLFGSMHIKSYDWVDVPKYSNDVINPAHSPCEASILYPADGGNMHCFTARTSCAVLDVLGPPYSDPEGRHCTYYNNFPYASFPGTNHTWATKKTDLIPRPHATTARELNSSIVVYNLYHFGRLESDLSSFPWTPPVDSACSICRPSGAIPVGGTRYG
ncbi:plant cysteine oxidase 2-like isoform X3 [Phoenix dactylifera]|uniref:cysteine dioxygenase n=1 Tax=Phoenix dactylifera TaxID=42345 RepID=A0A8B8J420_PHODC|nr:plant cysteine oxidase 2-like isoform X3 [Phoenix dactylifera]